MQRGQRGEKVVLSLPRILTREGSSRKTTIPESLKENRRKKIRLVEIYTYPYSEEKNNNKIVSDHYEGES